MKKYMITLCACVCAAAMTACVSTSPGNDSSKPVAADVDDAKPAPYTQDGDYIIYGHYEQDGNPGCLSPLTCDFSALMRRCKLGATLPVN